MPTATVGVVIPELLMTVGVEVPIEALASVGFCVCIATMYCVPVQKKPALSSGRIVTLETDTPFSNNVPLSGVTLTEENPFAAVAAAQDPCTTDVVGRVIEHDTEDWMTVVVPSVSSPDGQDDTTIALSGAEANVL